MSKIKSILAFAALMLCGGAWAATVESNGDTYTIYNTSKSNTGAFNNAGNYKFSGNPQITIQIPAKGGLKDGDIVELESITWVNGGSATTQYCLPTSITLCGQTVTAADNADKFFGVSLGEKVYAFNEGSRPKLVVGRKTDVTTTGCSTNFRTTVNASNSDNVDLLIGIDNNTQYQPLTRIVCHKVEIEKKLLYHFALNDNLNNTGSITEGYTLTQANSSQSPAYVSGVFETKALNGTGDTSQILSATNKGDILPGLEANSHWTISMWVNYNNQGTDWRDVAGFSIGNKFMEIQRSNAKTYNIYGGANTFSTSDSDGIPAGEKSEWVNIVIVSVGDGHSYEVYGNGRLFKRCTGASASYGTGNQGLTSISIGSRTASGISNGSFTLNSRGQNSYIDEVAVFNYALPEGAILALQDCKPNQTMVSSKPIKVKKGYDFLAFDTIADALTDIGESAATIILSRDNTENVTLHERLVLDTNGFAHTGTLSGAGKIVYHGNTMPANPKFGNNWTGTCSFKDFKASCQLYPDNFANENSSIEFNGVHFFVAGNDNAYKAKEIILTNDGTTPAWTIDNGWWNSLTKFKKLTGSGSIYSAWASSQRYSFASAEGFTGSLTTYVSESISKGPHIIFGDQDIPTAVNGGDPYITILANGSALVDSTATWKAKNGVVVKGMISGTGTIAAPLTVADGATINVSGNGDAALQTNGTVDFGGVLKLVGASNGAIILKNVTTVTRQPTSVMIGDDANYHLELDGTDLKVVRDVACYGGQSYATLKDALSAAEDVASAENQQTVTLLATSAENVSIPANVIVAQTQASQKLTGTITGTGTIKLTQSATSNTADLLSWINQADTMNDFAGTIHLNAGRFELKTADVAHLAKAKFKVTDGAQAFLGGGTWNNAFTISGSGYGGETGNIGCAAIRIHDGVLGADATVTSEDANATIGVNNGQKPVPCAITASNGIAFYTRYGTDKLTFTGAISGNVTKKGDGSVVIPPNYEGAITLLAGTIQSASDELDVTTTVEDKVVGRAVNGETTTYSLVDPVAEYNGTKYATLQEAINAASDENLGQITILAVDAAVPQGYRVKGGKVVTTADYYSRWTNTASAAAIVNLKTTASFHNSNFTVFDPATDTESTVFNGNTTGTPPFGGLSSMRYPWQIFASQINNDANSAYIAPGVALRFTGDVRGALMDATFAPLTFAGFIVEPGATGFGYKSWKDNSNRHTEVGRTGYTTHSHISEDFEIYRARENTAMGLTFKGTHVLEIDAQKTFHINDATKDSHNYADVQYKTTVEEGGCLKLVGAGTLSVSTLNATGATIDLSAIGTTTTAFITGNVAVDAATKINFPENWAAGTAMKLCSGTITGTASTDAVDVKIGEKTEHVILSYDSENGTVSYAYAPTAQTWTNGTIIFDGDLHHLTANEDGTYTKTIGDVTYTINLNGHELKTEDGKSYILIKEVTNGLGVTITRNSASNATGASIVMKYTDYPAFDSSKTAVPLTIHNNMNDVNYQNVATVFVDDASGNMKAGWADIHNGKQTSAAGSVVFNGEDGCLALAYGRYGQGDAGIYSFQQTGTGWSQTFKNTGLAGNGTHSILGFAVGGVYVAHNRGVNVANTVGLKVHAVAVKYAAITSATDANLTALVWPSEAYAEAKIGKELYDTVEEAIAATTTGESKTVSLNKDIAAGASIEIPEGVTLDIKGHNLNRAVTGEGTLIINKNITRTSTQSEDNDVNLPSALTTSLKNADNWHGEVVLVGGFDNVQMNPLFNLCNANSKLTSKGNKGWLLQNSLQNITLNLVDNGTTPALYISNSSYTWKYKAKLAGDGTIKVDSSSNTPIAAILVTDATEFCGNIHMTDLSLYFGGEGEVLGNGLIKINSGTTMKVYPTKTWHAGTGGIEVAGTIKGSGTLEGTVAFDENSTLDLTDGMLTATTAAANGAFTVKVENLETFLAGDKQIMTLTAGGNSIYAAAVTVTDGTENAPTTYVLKTTPTAAVLVVAGSHTWTGETDGALNNPANWGIEGEMFSGENQFVVFPADATTKTVNVSNITLGKITINGAYTFTGNGTITLSELAFGEGGSLKLGTGTTIKLPGALDKSLLSKITFAGGNIAVKEVPHFTQSENLMVDPTAYTTQGGHLLISWTDFMTHGEYGYGLPKLNSTALNPAATKTNHATAMLGEIAWGDNGSKARLLGMYGKIYLEVRTAEQLARKPIRILPLGDSITEGFNNTGNCANYRTQLAAKLSMAGYMVETLGYHYVRSRMPSGEWAPVEWQYHAGVSAQRVWTQRPTSNGVEYNNRAGDMEALETTLNACGGTPDVVLVKLGTNDIGRGDDKDHIYQGLTNILTAVHKKFPDAKVITTTAVNYKSNPQIRKDYNALIRNAFATGGEFTKSEYNKWLYFVDQCKKVGDGTDDGSYYDKEERRLFITDNTHPDWAGHDLMSDGWYEKIVDIIKVGDGKDKPAKVACKLGAKANVPAEYLNGFVRYRQLDIDEEATYPQTAFDDYTWKSEKTVNNITKVGYFMELVRKDSGEHTFVWVDMDNFGNDTVQSFGLPTTATTQRSVSKLHVYSNLGCIHNVEANDDTVNGYIEFSPFNATAGAVTGAPTKLWDSMDWNDTYATSGAGRGAMQIHRVKKVGDKLWNGAEVLFAYNNWGSANTGVAGTKAGEIGIGNFAQHYVGDHTANGNGQEINELYGSNTINIGGGEASNNVSVDYTATRFSPVGDKVNAKAYEVMRLEIWVKGTVSGDAAEEPVVITTIPEAGLEIKPDDEVKVPVGTVEAKIAVKYTDANGTTTDLKTRGYVSVSVADNGAVTVATTNNAKPDPVKIKMTMPKEGEGQSAKDKVYFTITDPIPGLFYSIVSANGPTDAHFESGDDSDGVQATSSDPHTTSIDMPDAKVKYFRVRVKATK